MADGLEMFGPAALTVTQGVGAFALFLPRFTDVRRNNPKDNPDFAGDVRTGEIAAATITLGVGAIASYFTGSSAPVITALFIVFVMIFVYESTLRTVAPFEGKPLTLGSLNA